MIDVGSIASLTGSLKAASDIAKAMITLRDAEAFQAKAIELNREIMSAQSGALAAYANQAALFKRVSDLEKRLAEFEAWEREKSRYQLTQSRAGMFCYVLKEEARGAEPMHRLCASCYQKGEKSILHRWTTYDSGNVDFRCMRCTSHFTLDGQP
jgi:hypothetical protein